MAIQCWADLLKYGAREHLANTFGEYLLGEGETEAEYDVSLKIDLERIPQSAGTCLPCCSLISGRCQNGDTCGARPACGSAGTRGGIAPEKSDG